MRVRKPLVFYLKGKNMLNLRKCRGFTLVEMLVVICIIAILAGLTMTMVNSARRSTRAKLAATDIKGLYLAFERFKAKFGQYPFIGDDGKTWNPEYVTAGISDGNGIKCKLIKLLIKHNMFSCEGSQLSNEDSDIFLDPFGKGYIVSAVKSGSDSQGLDFTTQRCGLYIYSSGGDERDADKSEYKKNKAVWKRNCIYPGKNE